MSKGQITYLNINTIYPHPNNPRKDLGDLAELAESIKSNGIMQNLTVVPWVSQFTGQPGDNSSTDGSYTAVIGHRRHAAAKLAGLEEVPCIISDMDIKAQIATMLLENIQRSDLSVTEEAEGFQLMLDFGESVSTISTQTGFSENTIRRRIKLLELDRKKLKEAEERGGTLQDYSKLDKIKDPKLKNEVLEKIGTSNFKWELDSAIKKEQQEENKLKLIEILDSFAERVEAPDRSSMSYVKYIGLESDSFDIPNNLDKRNYYYILANRHIELWADKLESESVKSNADPVQEAKNRELKERREKLEEVAKRAYMLRYEFIANYAGLKKHTKGIAELAMKIALDASYHCEDDIMELLGIEVEDDSDEDAAFNKIVELYSKSPERVMAVIIYCWHGDSDRNKSTRYYDSVEYLENKNLSSIYEAIEKLGYETSDEERAMLNGTHDLYNKKTEE